MIREKSRNHVPMSLLKIKTLKPKKVNQITFLNQHSEQVMKDEFFGFGNSSKIDNINIEFISSQNLVTVVQVLPSSVINGMKIQVSTTKRKNYLNTICSLE